MIYWLIFTIIKIYLLFNIMENKLERTMDNINIQYFRNILNESKFKKFRLPKITIPKPSRWFIVMIAILLEIILLFFILWLFDDRTVFNNDYISRKYSYDSLKWGWFHSGITILSIICEIILTFAIAGEFLAYNEKGRTFYELYK